MYDDIQIRIRMLENAFVIEVPDMEEIAKKQAAAKKAMATGKGEISPYLGDCTKSFAAKSVKEVLKLIQAAIEKMPESEFDTAFDEAAEPGK